MTTSHTCAIVATLLLAACSQQVAEGPRVEPAPVVSDTFCETARKRTWSVKDTPATIRAADAWNRAIDRRCGRRPS